MGILDRMGGFFGGGTNKANPELANQNPSLKFSLKCTVYIPGKDQPYFVERHYPNPAFPNIDSPKKITHAIDDLKQYIINALGNSFPGIQISKEELVVECNIYDNQETVASLIQKDLDDTK